MIPTVDGTESTLTPGTLAIRAGCALPNSSEIVCQIGSEAAGPVDGVRVEVHRRTAPSKRLKMRYDVYYVNYNVCNIDATKTSIRLDVVLPHEGMLPVG